MLVVTRECRHLLENTEKYRVWPAFAHKKYGTPRRSFHFVLQISGKAGASGDPAVRERTLRFGGIAPARSLNLLPLPGASRRNDRVGRDVAFRCMQQF